jgi:hypothetical protein
MTDLSWPSQVRDALGHDAKLFPDIYIDIFASTWAASHVRLVELAPSQPTTDLALLFFVASRRIGSCKAWKEWITATSSSPMNRGELQTLIDHAISDIAEVNDTNSILEHALRSLSAQSADRICSLSGNPYEYGPTYQAYWWRASTFVYLEVHNES